MQGTEPQSCRRKLTKRASLPERAGGEGPGGDCLFPDVRVAARHSSMAPCLLTQHERWAPWLSLPTLQLEPERASEEGEGRGHPMDPAWEASLPAWGQGAIGASGAPGLCFCRQHPCTARATQEPPSPAETRAQGQSRSQQETANSDGSKAEALGRGWLQSADRDTRQAQHLGAHSGAWAVSGGGLAPSKQSPGTVFAERMGRSRWRP